MTYIERYDWCLSSLSGSILCPSNVDKSTQPWPLLSSSFASTLLISNTNNDNIPLNTDIISSTFFSQEEDKVTYVLSSSLDHSHDYYTNKRIEQLHDRMDDIQISSFLKFINYHLSSKNEQHKLVKDLSQDLSNGHILIDLIEIFSSTKLKREYGRTRFHSLTNVQYVLDYLKLHMQHINISPHEIVSGNRKQILALLWIMMKIFDFPSFRLTTNKHLFHENTLFSLGQDRSILLKWINKLLNQILNTHLIYIKDFSLQTWIDKSYLSLIIKYLCPLSVKYGTLEYFNYFKQLDDGNLNDKERLELCLKFSNYCFDTVAVMDDADRTEKSLFRFFSELQQNILFILKSNQIGKLTKTNPYTKQLLETITIIEHSQMMNDDEDYLICTEDEQQNLPSDSCNNELLTSDTISPDETEQTTIKTENLEESVVGIESLSPSDDVTNTIQEQQLCSQTSAENLLSIHDDHLQNPRSRKIKKKRSTISLERLASLSPTPNNDLFEKIIDCLRDPKLITLKYILILACFCFSILIIFIHK